MRMSLTAVALSPDSSAVLMRLRVCALRRAISSAEAIACAMSGLWTTECYLPESSLDVTHDEFVLTFEASMRTHTRLTAVLVAGGPTRQWLTNFASKKSVHLPSSLTS